MKKYTYQKFLLQCPYSVVDLSICIRPKDPLLQDYSDKEYNLSDWRNHLRIRSICLSELDRHIDTIEDFEQLLSRMAGIDVLVIINDRPHISNPIAAAYSTATLQAFVWRFRNAGFNCWVDDSE